jgi:hypothetical protein
MNVSPGMSAAKDGRRQAHMDVLVAVLGGTIATLALLAANSRRKKTTKTKVVASKFVVYSDSVRRNPAASGGNRGVRAKSYF